MSDSDRFVRETFIATRRHDLRTPINAILGYSETLLEDAREEGNDSRAEDLKKIHAAGQAEKGLDFTPHAINLLTKANTQDDYLRFNGRTFLCEATAG